MLAIYKHEKKLNIMADFLVNNKGDGTYVFYDIKAGKYCYTVSKDRYVTVEDEVTVYGGDSHVDVTLLKERFKVVITVNDENDNAVTDAAVESGDFTVTNNGDGTYEFETIYGEYEYTVSKERYVTVKGTVEVDREDVHVTVKLERYLFNLTISVTDEDDEPIVDADTTLSDECEEPGEPPTIIGEDMNVKTGDQVTKQLEFEGDGPATWSIVDGVLPRELTLNSETGLISGKVVEYGEFPFTVRIETPYGESTKELNIVSEKEEEWGCGENPIAQGKTGVSNQLDWCLSSNGTLFISGEGAMSNWTSANGQSWSGRRNQITSVKIGNSVTTIGNYAFQSCHNLTEVTIGNSVITIGTWVFQDCGKLTSITIPDSVTSIGNLAFSGCYNLTSLIIGNSVETIGEQTFQHCHNLTSITIPNLVTTIGGWAFDDCIGLIEIINHAATPQIINANVFRGVNINNITLKVPAESVDAYNAANVWRNMNVVAINDSV